MSIGPLLSTPQVHALKHVSYTSNPLSKLRVNPQDAAQHVSPLTQLIRKGLTAFRRIIKTPSQPQKAEPLIQKPKPNKEWNEYMNKKKEELEARIHELQSEKVDRNDAYCPEYANKVQDTLDERAWVDKLQEVADRAANSTLPILPPEPPPLTEGQKKCTSQFVDYWMYAQHGVPKK